MDDSEMESTPDDSDAGRQSKSWASYIPWVICLLAVAGIYFARSGASESDHALANILSVLLGVLLWGAAMVGLLVHRETRRWGVLLGLAPLIGFAALFGLYKFERLDSELVPQFKSRFASDQDLPTEEMTSNSVDDARFLAAENDFPQFLGPNRDGVLQASLDVDWEQNPPQILWKQPIGQGWSGFVTQGDVAVTMEQRDESEWVTAYSILDGTLIWKYAIDALHTTVPGGAGPRSTPAIADGRVFACSAVGEFACLDLRSGEPVWSRNLLDMAEVKQEDFEQWVAWGRSGSPLVAGGKVYLPFGGTPGSNQPLIAFATEDGEVIWKAGSGQISYSSPFLHELDGVLQLLLVSEGKAAGYDPETGDQLWEVEWPGTANANPAVAHPVPYGKKGLLLAKGYSEGAKLIEVSQRDGAWSVEEVWKSRSVMKTKFATAVLLDGYAYGLSDGILECIDVATGKRQWKRGRYKHGQLLLLDDKLLILAETGELIVVAARPDQHEELASFQAISGVSWNTLALSGDRLLVRNSDEAACIKLPLVVDSDARPDAPGQQATDADMDKANAGSEARSGEAAAKT